MSDGGATRRQWLGLGALSVGALALGHWVKRGRSAGADVTEALDVPAFLGARGFPAEGPADARVTMLVFSDYACGVCRQVEPAWRAAVRDARSVRVVHRDWPILGPASRRAARVALAADRQGLYARVHTRLIESGRHDEAALRRALVEAGGDWGRLESDLARHGSAIDRLLARTAQDAQRLGFRGTSGFLIGPIRIEGGASERQFSDAIERARTHPEGESL